MALRSLARAVLSGGHQNQGLFVLLHHALFHDRTQQSVLPPADRGDRPGLARVDARNLPVRLESVAAHHPSEAFEGGGGERPVHVPAGGGLGHKLGPVLFQLPPSLKADRERLARFLDLLPKDRRHTFEFRHPSWYEPPILDLLGEHDAALCLSDHAAAPAPWAVTASFVYIRAHGPSGRYWGSYSDETLRQWADDIAAWRSQGRAVYCYFDNDIKSAAPADAQRLFAMLQPAPIVQPAPAPSRARRARGPDRRDGSSPRVRGSPEPPRSPGSRAR